MKKRIALILFAAMLVSMLAGCGGDSSTDSTDDSAGTTETSGADPSDSSIQGKFLYIITDNLGDMGFRDTGLRGVQNVCETYGCEYDVIELGGDKSTYENAFADACDSGEYAYIITCSNGGMSDLVLKYGPEYPEIKFVTFDVGATTEVTSDNVCAINACLQVDLTGQVNCEWNNGRIFSGVGGQSDFLRGAAYSKGGKPILCLPSTAKGETISRIVPLLPQGVPVSTARIDVHWVVTEYGAVNLFGLGLRERGEALISIAHPKFRDQLQNEFDEFWRGMKL